MFCLRSLGALSAAKDISIQQEQSVDLLRECIMIRDIAFALPDFYTVADVQPTNLYIYSCRLDVIYMVVLFCIHSLSVCLSLCLLVYCVYELHNNNNNEMTLM